MKKYKFKLKGTWTEKELKTVSRFLKQFWPVLKQNIKSNIKNTKVKTRKQPRSDALGETKR